MHKLTAVRWNQRRSAVLLSDGHMWLVLDQSPTTGLLLVERHGFSQRYVPPPLEFSARRMLAQRQRICTLAATRTRLKATWNLPIAYSSYYASFMALR